MISSLQVTGVRLSKHQPMMMPNPIQESETEAVTKCMSVDEIKASPWANVEQEEAHKMLMSITHRALDNFLNDQGGTAKTWLPN